MCFSRWFIASGLLLASLVCLLHAGTASAIHFDFQTIFPASFSPVVTIERWDINLAGDRKQPPGSPLQLYVQSRLPQAGAIFPPTVAQKSPGTMSHHDRNGEREESPELVSIAGLAFVQESQPEFFARVPASLVQLCLKQKQRLLTILHKKMQWAQTCGNRDLVRILRDRIMLIEVDRDFLQQQTPYSAPSFQARTQEWLPGDSQEIQLYGQVINDGGCQTSGNSFSGKRGRQATGSGGNGTSEVGTTSRPAGQTGMIAQKNGVASHHLTPAASDHNEDERERGDEPPPAKKAQPGFAASVVCSRCQKTLHKQEVTRLLQGSTAEPVTCDACLYSASQTLPQETTGKKKATGKRTRPGGEAAPEPKRGKSQPGKRKQGPGPQGRPAAKKVRLENPGTGPQLTPGTVEELEVLEQHLAFRMNDQEREAAKQLFEHLQYKKLKIKASLYKLLAKVGREELPRFCAKASVFFSSLTATIKDTGCLTSMLDKKKHWQDFAGRDDSELEYLAGLDTLRAFSSMNNRKGFPGKAEVKAVLAWPEWKNENGQFNMQWFRTFSSMNHGKGLPKQTDVKAVLAWPEWKDKDGQFSMELFRTFSSMNSSRGLPRQTEVKAVLAWPEWKDEDSQFSMERFRAFSSMNHGKGLPGQAEVKAVLAWPEWKDEDGQFSMERFRAFSSMNHGKGLLEQEEVKAVLAWPEWKDESGQFSIQRFRAFSSMNNGKGLPRQTDVKAVLAWPEWKDGDGQFSMERFRSFSSMNHGKGLPEQAEVKAMLAWPEWKDENGQFSIERFRAFSSMNHSKGFPEQAEVKAVLAWLNCGEILNNSLQRLVKLYVSQGVPDTKKLKQYEQKLSELFFANAVTGPENDDKDEQHYLIKSATLFLSTRKPRYFLSFEDVERFYQQVTTGDAGYKLKQLITLLHSYGREGVTCYLALNNSDRNALLNTCTSCIPLPLAMKVIRDFLPSERNQYLFFSRNLKAPPDKGQWHHIRLQLNRLASVLKTSYARRLYLEVIWSLAPSEDRDLFLDEARAASVTALFPSLKALKNLANRHSRQWLKELLEACLQYGQGAPSRESIKRLFTALLETQLPIPGHGDIPDYFLSGYTALEDSAIFIPVTPPVQTTEELALHFVAAVTRVLSNMFYHYEANRLKVEQYGGEIHSFPVPELKIHDNGIEISNWPTRVFQRFLAVTEFPEHYYLSKDAWQKHCNPGSPGYFQRRMVACPQRERAAIDTIVFQPLSIPVLIALLKNNIHLSPTAWESFDHHKDRLPRAVHNQLLHEMEKAVHEVIPVSLREYLESRRPPEEEALPQNQMDAPASTPPFPVMETLSEEEQFRKLWTDLSRKGLVMVTDLELLAGYKEHMTMKNIVDILKRTDAGMEPGRLYEFRQLLGEKIDRYSRQDPLFLELDDEIASYLTEFDI